MTRVLFCVWCCFRHIFSHYLYRVLYIAEKPVKWALKWVTYEAIWVDRGVGNKVSVKVVRFYERPWKTIVHDKSHFCHFFPNFSLFICRIAVNWTQFSAELTSTRFQILLLLVTILVLSRCDFMFYQLKQIWNLAYQTARKIKNFIVCCSLFVV